MTKYANYLGRYGRTHLWKFGESTNTYSRKYSIRAEARKCNIKSANNFNFLEISYIAETEPEALFVESTIRELMAVKGYAIEKNDHFRTNKKASEVIADYHAAFAMAAEFLTRARQAQGDTQQARRGSNGLPRKGLRIRRIYQ